MSTRMLEQASPPTRGSGATRSPETGTTRSPADPRSPGDTRSRILAVASTLFGERGYAGTSVRDISGCLGLTKAALYHHFPSKETILDALLEPFMLELGRLADLVRQTPPPSPDLVIERIAEVMTGAGGTLLLLVDDPSIIHRRIGERDMLSLRCMLVRVLAGPEPSSARLLRAHCAIGALKAGIMQGALERAIGGPAGASPAALRLVTSEERREIVAAALAALGSEDPAPGRPPA
ncbi:TetR/AcrR family transcriptional regulator [Frankia sp. R82]|uniref:TetR/AcrR family transcriptional regulator n=1 Tax=Frankia sp. R82 TaxID=2950553 RepID=UPI002042BFFC|nr:TetR/AcrR family transcriptional regulator [Frankia sp. R82]MCM3887144.1 TetR/AcrR family transcriptional regulator [Frankia sp. R82]